MCRPHATGIYLVFIFDLTAISSLVYLLLPITGVMVVQDLYTHKWSRLLCSAWVFKKALPPTATWRKLPADTKQKPFTRYEKRGKSPPAREILPVIGVGDTQDQAASVLPTICTSGVTLATAGLPRNSYPRCCSPNSCSLWKYPKESTAGAEGRDAKRISKNT